MILLDLKTGILIKRGEIWWASMEEHKDQRLDLRALFIIPNINLKLFNP